MPQAIEARQQETRILVVDNSELMRRSLRTLLEGRDHWKVYGEASNGQEAVTKFSNEKFDVSIYSRNWKKSGLPKICSGLTFRLIWPSTILARLSISSLCQLRGWGPNPVATHLLKQLTLAVTDCPVGLLRTSRVVRWREMPGF